MNFLATIPIPSLIFRKNFNNSSQNNDDTANSSFIEWINFFCFLFNIYYGFPPLDQWKFPPNCNHCHILSKLVELFKKSLTIESLLNWKKLKQFHLNAVANIVIKSLPPTLYLLPLMQKSLTFKKLGYSF